MSTNAYVRFAVAVVLDRVRERRPGGAERDHHERDHRGDPDGGRVDARLAEALVPDDEHAVDEVDRPQRERGRHERQAELLHLAEQLAVELEPELLGAVGDQHEVDASVPGSCRRRSRSRPSGRPRRTATIAPTVISTFAMLAIANATERSSARNRFVSCW